MSTPILPFAVWASGTNQASIPANDNSLRNQILNGLVIDDATTAQPGSPIDGDIYILPGTHTGTQWATFDEDDLVIFTDGTWYAFAPSEGVVVNLAGALRQFLSGVWDDAGGSGGGTKVLQIACSDELTPLTAGTNKIRFRMPYAMTTLTAVRASLTTAQASGSIFTVDINEAGSTILSTKLTIDNTEKTSTTAATAAVISDSALADDAEMSIDIDQIGDGTATGLKVTLIGT
jgi:hypothetical protein